MSDSSTVEIISSSEPGPSKTKGIIAVDMDDVLAQTNMAIVDMHNEKYGIQPPMTIDDFENYLYWHNRGWGTRAETVEKVQQLISSGLLDRPDPVPGAKAGLEKLRELGYSLIIVTARSERQREQTEAWLENHLPDIFDEIHFTEGFQHLLPPNKTEQGGHAARKTVIAHVKRTKAEIIHQTGALVLIDDSADNAYETSLAEPSIPFLLFGKYAWNAVVPQPHKTHPDDKLTYVEREQAGKQEEYQQRRREAIREGWLPRGVTRVDNWDQVVEWVKNNLDKPQV